MKVKQHILYAVLLLLPAVSAVAEDTMIASVNGSVIYDSDVRGIMSEKLPYVSFHRNISDEKLKALRSEVLDGIIEEKLLCQAGRNSGIIPDERAVEEKMAKKKSSFRSEKDFAEGLERDGLAVDKLRSRMMCADVARQFVDREVVKKSVVSDDYLASYYSDNKAKFLEPEKWKLREIFFRVAPEAAKAERQQKRMAAQEVLEKVRGGQDFGLLAWELSEDDYKYKSGDIGYMHKEMLLPEIEKALEGVEAGNTTGVIETIFGYYIFYMESKSPARQLSFEEVKGKLKKEMQEQKEKELKKNLIEGLRSKAEIHLMGEGSPAPSVK